MQSRGRERCASCRGIPAAGTPSAPLSDEPSALVRAAWDRAWGGAEAAARTGQYPGAANPGGGASREWALERGCRRCLRARKCLGEESRTP